jgi:hypothetical protein
VFSRKGKDKNRGKVSCIMQLDLLKKFLVLKMFWGAVSGTPACSPKRPLYKGRDHWSVPESIPTYIIHQLMWKLQIGFKNFDGCFLFAQWFQEARKWWIICSLSCQLLLSTLD